MFKKEQVIELQRWYESVGVPKDLIPKEISQLEIEMSRRLPRSDRKADRAWLKKCLPIIERLIHQLNQAPKGLIEEIVRTKLGKEQKVLGTYQLDDRDKVLSYLSSTFLSEDIEQGIKSFKAHIVELIASKQVSSAKLTNDFLALFCKKIEMRYSLNFNREKVVQFICACTGKERETVKKQIQRLGLPEYDSERLNEIYLVSGRHVAEELFHLKSGIDRALNHLANRLQITPSMP